MEAECLEMPRNEVLGEVLSLPLGRVFVNPHQPRRVFDSAALFDLAESIRRYGVMQPISVRRGAVAGSYELIAGERRLRASRLAGLAAIPAIVTEVDERDSAILALIENMQRENLNYIEEAEALSRLISEYGLTQEALARNIGKSQSSVANKLRLLKLPDDIKTELLSQNLTERHARALLNLPADELKREALKKIIANSLNVKSAESMIEQMLKTEALSRRKRKITPFVRDVRLLFNSIRQAVEMMNDGGLPTDFTVEESDEAYNVVVVVKKPAVSAV